MPSTGKKTQKAGCRRAAASTVSTFTLFARSHTVSTVSPMTPGSRLYGLRWPAREGDKKVSRR